MPFDLDSYQDGMKKLAELAAKHFRDMARISRNRQYAMAYEEAADYIERASGLKKIQGP
jgi:hypothetical protein